MHYQMSPARLRAALSVFMFVSLFNWLTNKQNGE